ncbi:MAG: hypothetical protein EOO78_28530 [Oxalobacteraceae bacterium]|nr:MAG: hypothetical protein EOO78_28530 [Oxalobacteraceae bacterium]
MLSKSAAGAGAADDVGAVVPGQQRRGVHPGFLLGTAIDMDNDRFHHSASPNINAIVWPCIQIFPMVSMAMQAACLDRAHIALACRT